MAFKVNSVRSVSTCVNMTTMVWGIECNEVPKQLGEFVEFFHANIGIQIKILKLEANANQLRSEESIDSWKLKRNSNETKWII